MAASVIGAPTTTLDRRVMKLPDLPQDHAQPVEIIYNAHWLDSLLKESRSGRGSEAHMPKRKFILDTSAQQRARDGSLRTVIAVSPSQHDAVERLVRRRYAWRGYNLPQTGTADDVAALHPEPTRVTLLAEDRGTLVGTLTLGLDSPRGLMAEQTYGEEIERVRSQSRKVGELVRLAMAQGVDWKSVLDALVQASYRAARVVHAMTDLFIEVNPRHVRFYQRVFGFAAATAERQCARVGAPSVLMHLDLEQFGQRLNLSAF